MKFLTGTIIGSAAGFLLVRRTVGAGTPAADYDPYAIPFGDQVYLPLRPNGYEWSYTVTERNNS